MENASINCPTCGAAFPAGASFCPKCGYVVPPTAPHAVVPPAPVVFVEQPAPPAQVVYVETPAAPANWGPWIAGIVAVLALAGGYALWNAGYLGGASSTTVIDVAAEPAPSAPPTQDINITVPPAATPPATPPPAAPPASSSARPEIVSVSAKALEQGSFEWKYGYELKLRNTSATDLSVNLKIKFLDAKGFVVDDDLTSTLTVPANSEKSFAGSDLIKADKAATIKSVTAEFR